MEYYLDGNLKKSVSSLIGHVEMLLDYTYDKNGNAIVKNRIHKIIIRIMPTEAVLLEYILIQRICHTVMRKIPMTYLTAL